jgi:hypothetical protein
MFYETWHDYVVCLFLVNPTSATCPDYSLDLSGLGENTGLLPVACHGMVWRMKLHQDPEFKRVPEKNSKIKIELSALKLF